VWGVCATSYRHTGRSAELQGLQLAPDVRRGHVGRGCLLPAILHSSVQSPANVTFPGSTATADQRCKRQPDLISGASQNVSNKYYRCSFFLLNLTRSFRSKEISADALGTVLEQKPLSRVSGTGAVYSHLQFCAEIVFPSFLWRRGFQPFTVLFFPSFIRMTITERKLYHLP
jgi:hypothetical protein